MLLKMAFGSNAGFQVYPKAQVAGDAQQHVDAVALHREYRCVVVIEGKRLYSAEKYVSLGNDWIRLQRIKLPCEWLPFPRPLNSYALLIGSCWNSEYVHWWTDPMRGPAPIESRTNDAWVNMFAALQDAVRIGAVDVRRPGWQQHWICYSLHRLPDDHWCATTSDALAPIMTV
jgi:hypothetical protein